MGEADKMNVIDRELLRLCDEVLEFAAPIDVRTADLRKKWKKSEKLAKHEFDRHGLSAKKSLEKLGGLKDQKQISRLEKFARKSGNEERINKALGRIKSIKEKIISTAKQRGRGHRCGFKKQDGHPCMIKVKGDGARCRFHNSSAMEAREKSSREKHENKMEKEAKDRKSNAERFEKERQERKEAAPKAAEKITTSKAVIDDFEKVYSSLTSENSKVVSFDKLFDELKAKHPGMTNEQFHAVLKDLNDKEIIDLQPSNDRSLIPKGREGLAISTSLGELFYVMDRRDPTNPKSKNKGSWSEQFGGKQEGKAEEKAAEESMPELIGEKEQVIKANKIRAEVIKKIGDEISLLSGEEKNKAKLVVDNMLSSITNPKMWINNGEMLKKDAVKTLVDIGKKIGIDVHRKRAKMEKVEKPEHFTYQEDGKDYKIYRARMKEGRGENDPTFSLVPIGLVKHGEIYLVTEGIDSKDVYGGSTQSRSFRSKEEAEEFIKSRVKSGFYEQKEGK